MFIYCITRVAVVPSAQTLGPAFTDPLRRYPKSTETALSMSGYVGVHDTVVRKSLTLWLAATTIDLL
jgi:hypothetical protein